MHFDNAWQEPPAVSPVIYATGLTDQVTGIVSENMANRILDKAGSPCPDDTIAIAISNASLQSLKTKISVLTGKSHVLPVDEEQIRKEVASITIDSINSLGRQAAYCRHQGTAVNPVVHLDRAQIMVSVPPERESVVLKVLRTRLIPLRAPNQLFQYQFISKNRSVRVEASPTRRGRALGNARYMTVSIMHSGMQDSQSRREVADSLRPVFRGILERSNYYLGKLELAVDYPLAAMALLGVRRGAQYNLVEHPQSPRLCSSGFNIYYGKLPRQILHYDPLLKHVDQATLAGELGDVGCEDILDARQILSTQPDGFSHPIPPHFQTWGRACRVEARIRPEVGTSNPEKLFEKNPFRDYVLVALPLVTEATWLERLVFARLEGPQALRERLKRERVPRRHFGEAVSRYAEATGAILVQPSAAFERHRAELSRTLDDLVDGICGD